MNDRDKILEKIKKCLALAKSSNEHEAAAALRQAQKLMKEYGLTDTDVLAHQASEARAKASDRSTPPVWENYLAQIVASAFECRTIYSRRWNESSWVFIGCGAASEVAQYAFTVLFRQLKGSRANFIKHECKRLKPANKTRRADLFCEAWVDQVYEQIQAFCGASKDEASQRAIDAYVEKKYQALSELKTRDRNAGRNPRGKDWDAIDAGRSSGKNAQLNRGVGGSEQLALS